MYISYSSLNLNVISFVLSVYPSALEHGVKLKQFENRLLTSDELLDSLNFACKTFGSEVIFSLFFMPELSLRAVTSCMGDQSGKLKVVF